MSSFRLNRKVLVIKNNAVSFLNGLTSNAMTAPRNAFTNIHGKTIATFDQLKLSDDEIWMVLEEGYVEATLQHLERYLKLGGIKLEQREDLKVYFDLDDSYVLTGDDFSIPQRRGKIILTSKDLISNISEEEFQLFRVKNNIPQLGVDYKDEFLLNIGEDEFVSFTKGCFLGQEPISKVHNRSKPSWKLVVKSFEECSDLEKAKMTSKVFDSETKKYLGFVFEKNS